MISPGEHVCILGLTGCGKSTLTRALALPQRRVLVIDRMHEWDNADPALNDFTFTKDFPSFLAAYKESYAEVRIVVQPPPGMDGEMLREFADQILYCAYQAERQTRQGLFIVMEEVWLYAPIHGETPMLSEILLTGRKYGISVISNSQKPALVSRTVTGQSRHVLIGQHHDPRDAAFFREFGVTQSPAKFDWYHFEAGNGLRLIKNT